MAEIFETVHETEDAKVSAWIEKGCECNLGDESGPCSRRFSREDIHKIRDDLNQLSKNEKDIVVMGFLLASHIHSTAKEFVKKHFCLCLAFLRPS